MKSNEKGCTVMRWNHHGQSWIPRRADTAFAYDAHVWLCLHVCRVNSTNYCSFVRTPFQDRALARPRTLMCKFIVLKWLGLSQVWSIAFTFGGIWGDLREQESRFKLETCFLHVFASPSCMWDFRLAFLPPNLAEAVLKGAFHRRAVGDRPMAKKKWEQFGSNLRAIGYIVQLF